jgi:UDP-glucose 4-epimerase
MKLVTGGAGFIGSHLVDAFVARDETVRVVDDLSTGRKSFLAPHLRGSRVDLVQGSIDSPAVNARALRGVDEVWHLAADPDVRRAATDPTGNFRAGAVATLSLLEAMRKADARRLVFASSSTVYGEPELMPTPETYGPCLPISAYGAAKLAAEGLASAYAGLYGFQTWIYRFGNVVGPRLTHGVIHDFAKALRRDPKRLRILGNGRQEKSYLSTDDCIDGMLHGVAHARASVNVLNLASHEATNVRRIAEIVVRALGLRNVSFDYTGGERGWAGDVRRMRLDIRRMEDLGWRPRHTSEAAVERAAAWVAGAARVATVK